MAERKSAPADVGTSAGARDPGRNDPVEDARSEARNAYDQACSEVTVERWCEGISEKARDRVAEEAAVALVYHGVSHAVMLASPADLEDLGVGFTLSEGIARRDEIRSVEAVARDDGAYEVRLGIAAERFSALLRRERNTTGRTGCGLCGVANIEDAIRNPTLTANGVGISSRDLHEALSAIHRHQAINAQTGSVHAAAWVLPDKGIQIAREDVGRHNALDKVIGAVTRSGLNMADGWLLITSRASYEMVQKSVSVGVSLLAAVSAPTAFAVRLARESGLTLIGFARERRHVVYAHPQRIQP